MESRRKFRRTSLVGEIYRYELVGPPHFGLSNLRTVQDWILQRRLLSVPGVVQVNTWGGTTKEYDVDVDLQKLEAYGVTLPQVISAIGNANINVGGRTINVGQQSVNVRGVGLMDSGGETDLTQGYKVQDIENVMLSAPNGLPIFVKDVAKVSVGYVPRLGKAGRDHSDDVVAAIVIMNRTLHTNDVVTRVRAEIEKINTDGSLPPGLKLVPFYDRSSARRASPPAPSCTTLLFGCLLIFVGSMAFSRRPAQRHHRRRQCPVRIVLQHHHSRPARRRRKPAVGRRRRFRHHRRCRGYPGRERLSQFPGSAGRKSNDCCVQLAEKRWGDDPTGTELPSSDPIWTDRLRLILISGLQVDRAVLFSTAIIVAAFIPLFTMQGVEGQIFGPMARTYAYALVGALLATFTVTPCLTSLLLPEHVSEVETIVVRSLRRIYTPVLRWSLKQQAGHDRDRIGLPRHQRLPRLAPRQRVPADARGGQSVDSRVDAADPVARGGHADREPDAGKFCCAILKSSLWSRNMAVLTTAAMLRGSSMRSSSCR